MEKHKFISVKLCKEDEMRKINDLLRVGAKLVPTTTKIEKTKGGRWMITLALELEWK